VDKFTLEHVYYKYFSIAMSLSFHTHTYTPHSFILRQFV